MPRKADIEKVRENRNRARMDLDILCAGIGKQLMAFSDEYNRVEHLRMLMDKINGKLIPALEASEAAEKAYEPFWQRRRLHRRYTVRARKKVAPKKVVVQ